jgi:transposase
MASPEKEGSTSALFWLTKAQMERLRPFVPTSRDRPRLDDRRGLSGIIYVNRGRLMWREAPSACCPTKALYNGCVRWSRMGVFARMIGSTATQRSSETRGPF